ncbi:MAG TPA: M1 family aminopeptidase [Polyangiaceae bacterium]|nr:M1 family aminopeptidase [Polyangiaceae bacterium]
MHSAPVAVTSARMEQARLVPPANVPPPRDDGRLPAGASPRSYRWELTVDPVKPRFTGKVTIAARVAAPTRAIVLHGRGLTIRSAAVVTPSLGRLPATASFRKAAHSKGEADELVLTTAEEIPAGDTSFEISYDAPFAEGLHGLYRVEENGKSYAFTQFEPVGARLAFPCFDEPGFKVPFEVSVTVPSDMVALSNMPEAARTPSDDGGSVTVDFQRSPPLPTYLVALAVGPIEIREAPMAGKTPLRLGAVAGRTRLGDYGLVVARDSLSILQKYFGSAYPYPKLDLLAVPNFAAGAMENAGLVTFREERLLLDETTASTAMRRAIANTVAHELSHMWFGDLVTLAWWDDIWLNEGFATWMATRVLDTWRPELGAGVDELGFVAHVQDVDTLSSARKVRQPVRSTTDALEAFDGITYEKGAALLGMVERWITPDVFQKGVTTYLGEHLFGNATANDLFSALGRAGGQDVAAVLGSFTEQTGVPLVKMSACRLEKGVPVVRLTESEYQPLGAPEPTGKHWRIPVCVHVAATGAKDTACTLLTTGEARLTLPVSTCPRFIHPNADEAGYYHSTSSVDALTVLATLSRGALTVRERVGVLLDAWALVESGAVSAGDFLGLTQHFRGDPEPAVWQRIVDSLEYLDDEIVSDEDRPVLAAFTKRLLAQDARALGWEAIPKESDNDRMRRRLVLEALGRVGRDEPTLARARGVADRWLQDPASVDGDIASVALPLAAMSGDAGLFERFKTRLSTAKTPVERVLSLTALSSFTDPSLVRRALDLVLDGTVRAQDQAYIFRGVFARSAVRDVAFGIVRDRVDDFLAKIPPFARGRTIPTFARGCSEAESQRARALFEPKIASLEGADRGLSLALESTHRCAALREHERQPLGAWLSTPARARR